jgi:ABC-type sugar transport system permease subunit
MGIQSQEARSSDGDLAFSKNGGNPLWGILRIVGLMALNAVSLVVVYALIAEGDVGLGIILGLVTIGANLIAYVPALYPLRWMLPGLILITLLVIYPVIFTVSTAFTNYGDGHLFQKDVAVRLISERGYVPDNARRFNYTAYTAGEEDYALWLVDDSSGEVFFAKPGESLQPVDLDQFGFQLPGDPTAGGFTELEQVGPLIGAIGGQNTEYTFDEPVGIILVTMGSAANVETDARYVVTATQQTIYDRETDNTYDVTVLERDGDFGFAWEDAERNTYLARPGEPVIINNAPIIEGYEQVDLVTLQEAGIETLEYSAPISEIVIGSVDEVQIDDFGGATLYPSLVFDPEELLTIDQNTGAIFNTTVYQNPAGEYTFWLTETNLESINNAFVLFPGENRREVELSDRRLLRRLDIDLAPGTIIPNRVGLFERVTPSDEILGLERPEVTVGFKVDSFDFDAELVLDLEQGVTVNYTNGLIYFTDLYQSDNGDYALWMVADRIERRSVTQILARPDGPLMLDGTPSEFEGYERTITDEERANAVEFLETIETDYFGAPGETASERVGINEQQLGQAGQPFLLRYVYNETEQIFVDLSSIDATQFNIEDLNLDTRNPVTIEGFANVLMYKANDTDGNFEPVRLRLVYNEPSEAWVDLNTVSDQNLAEIDADVIAENVLGSLPGFGNAALYQEFAEQNIFAPTGFTYDAAENTFVSPDGNTFVFNEEAGVYTPPGWVYNETTNTFFNLSELGELDLNGIDLQQIDPDQAGDLLSSELSRYNFFEDQEVFAPEGFVYNAAAQAFVDVDSIPSRFDISDVDVATVDLDSNEAFERADIYYFDDATDSYVTRQFVYNTVSEAYVNTNDIPEDLTGVNLAEDNLFEIEGLERLSLLSVEAVREPFLYEGSIEPVFNEALGVYILLPDEEYSGVDLGAYNPETIATLEDLSAVRNQFNSIRISPLIYGETLARPVLDSDRFILGIDSSAAGLTPGYRVNIGLDNFRRLVEDPRYYSPLLDVFIWTVIFALGSVLTTFVVGLFMAIILNDDNIPAKKLIRSLLIIPYAIPGVIGILVWQGMMNENLGIITNTFADVFGVRPQWFTDPTTAKIAIFIVNLWLGYPYMMLVSSGALSAIPSDIYEAAAVDGARPMQRFWNITLPLLLVTIGPLLIASFTFNFNNYLMIELLTAGDPPIPGTPTDVGYTDILISYTYNLAFGTSRGADYGYASAITIVIFALVAVVTLFQFRFTKQWEEVGENV